MNLDQLVDSIEEIEFRNDLKKWVNIWKCDGSDIHQLVYLIGKWHGNVWMTDQTKQEKFWADFQTFKASSIECTGGLSMNERLYLFGLFEFWDAASPEDKQRIGGKLNASI